MGKKDTKLIRAAHIKRHTEGTSNEISFSVLDSLKNAADAEEGKDVKAEKPHFGGISLFALPSKKKPAPTPMKDDVLPLSGAAPQIDNTAFAPTVLGGGAVIGPSPSVAPGGALREKSSAAGKPLPALPAPKRNPAPSYKPPVDEIAQRKARRRRSRVTAAVLGVVAVIGLVGGLGYFLFTEYQNHQNQVSLLDQSFALLEKANEVIYPLDTLINTPAEKTTAAEIEGIQASLGEAKTHLAGVKSLATQAAEGMRDSTDKEAAERVYAAAEAREAMIAAAEPLLDADLQAEYASVQMQQAWTILLQADKLSREAAEMVTDTTKENVTASKDKTNEAVGQFNEALYVFNEVATNYPDVDVRPYQDYINKRIEALGHAIASDDAILEQNKQVADDENTAYNQADGEAAAMARELPGDPAEPAMAAYETKTADLRKQYSDARLKAGAADAFLDDYLGTGNK